MRGSKEIPGVTLDSSGNVVSYDIETQCHAVFENVRLVLEDAGATWQDIVDVTVFLTDMKKDFPIYNRIYAEYFAGPAKPNPTRTTIEVTCIAHTDRDRAKSDCRCRMIVIRRFRRFTRIKGFLVPFSRYSAFSALEKIREEQSRSFACENRRLTEIAPVHGCFSSQSFWKAGSARNGSQIGSSFKSAGVMGVGL